MCNPCYFISFQLIFIVGSCHIPVLLCGYIIGSEVQYGFRMNLNKSEEFLVGVCVRCRIC